MGQEELKSEESEDDEYKPYKGLCPEEFDDCCERIYNTEIMIEQE